MQIPDQPLPWWTVRSSDGPVCAEAGSAAPAEPETEVPHVATRTFEAGDSSMRLTIVHSGFGGASQASLTAPVLSQAGVLASRRAACIGRHTLYLALVG